jgi:hypothetical protein
LGILGSGIAALALAWDARSDLLAVPAAVLYLPHLALGRFLMPGAASDAGRLLAGDS